MSYYSLFKGARARRERLSNRRAGDGNRGGGLPPIEEPGEDANADAP